MTRTLVLGLYGDTALKEGQIAHVDRNAENAAEDNAAWLCLDHHSKYDSRSQQAKSYTPEELKAYRARLYEYMTSSLADTPSPWPDAGPSPTGGTGVSLEVFDRRVPMYRATIEFLRIVIRGDKLELQPIFAFASATDEALFIFDDHLAEYLSELYQRAVQLHGVYASRGGESSTRDLTREWTVCFGQCRSGLRPRPPRYGQAREISRIAAAPDFPFDPAKLKMRGS